MTFLSFLSGSGPHIILQMQDNINSVLKMEDHLKFSNGRPQNFQIEGNLIFLTNVQCPVLPSARLGTHSEVIKVRRLSYFIATTCFMTSHNTGIHVTQSSGN